MKKTTLVVLLVLVAGIATAFADAEKKFSNTVADYQIHLEFLNNQPKVGANPIAVEVKGPSGNSVTDAKLFIEYSMGTDKGKKMVIQEGMCFASELTCTGEKYTGELNFDKPGNWVIHVKTVRSGKSYTATFNTKVMK
jgi:hypothetical protein